MGVFLLCGIDFCFSSQVCCVCFRWVLFWRGGVDFLFFFFSLTVLTLAVKINDIKLLCDSLFVEQSKIIVVNRSYLICM